MPKFKLIAATALLALTGLSHAADGNDWELRIKNHGNSWTASFSGPTDYGPAGKRIKGSGVIVEKARALRPFSKLRLEGPMNVRLSQASGDAARVSADDNIEPLIDTRVEDDTLILRLLPGTGFSTRYAPTVWVDSKNLQALVSSGSGDIAIDKFKGDKLSLSLNGSGDLRIGLLEVNELDAKLSGSGDCTVAGRAERQNWLLQGSGDVDARSLNGSSARAQLSGSGDLNLGVTQNLDATLQGSGDLSYAGRPVLKQNVSGSGEINRR